MPYIGPNPTNSVLTEAQISTAGDARYLRDDLSDFPASFLSLRNKVINGNFEVWQRGNSGTTSGITYTADRWIILSYGVVAPWTKQAAPAPNRFSLAATGAAGNTGLTFAQRIEAHYTYNMAGRPATLSFKAYSLTAQSFIVTLAMPNVIDDFTNKTSQQAKSFSHGGTGWEYFTFTFPTIHANAINGIEIIFDFGAVTSGNRALAAVQFEEGSIATPFEFRPISLEQSLCQRYYQVMRCWFAGAATGATQSLGQTYIFPVALRTAPSQSNFSAVTVNAQAGTVGPITCGPLGPTGCNFSTQSSNAGPLIFDATASVNVEL